MFQYTVAAGDEDTNGVSIGAIDLNNGTIKDSVGNDATLTHTARSQQTTLSHKVDGVAPTVDSVSITSTASSHSTYKADEVIAVSVVFSENVNVTGTPQIGVSIGSNIRQAIYKSGKSTATTLVFEYTVVTGDNDADGIAIAANALQLQVNRDSIIDDGGNPATLTHSEVPTQAAHKVDAVVPTVNSVSITSDAGDAGTYTADEVIAVSVVFSETVVVTGTPQIGVSIGSNTRQADYQRGTGPDTLVFEYTVVTGSNLTRDEDIDGISIAADALQAGAGSSITDSVGHSATLTHSGVADNASHKVDTVRPFIVVNGVTIANGTIAVGKKIRANVIFNEPVTVTGTPLLTLTIGSARRPSSYESGTGTIKDPLVFAYTVAAGDSAPDGIAIAANALQLNGGSIKDNAGNAAEDTDLEHAEVAADRSRRIDAVKPTVSRISIVSDPGTDQTYVAGNTIQAEVVFSEVVLVEGTPRLPMEIGANTRHASYQNGSGTTKLLFAYTVAANDKDDDGISIPAGSIALNNGSIVDTAGNVGILTHLGMPADPVNPSHKVDGVKPGVSSIQITSAGPYGIWSNIEVTVTTTKPAYVTGSATVAVVIGNTPKTASYHAGSGTNALVFRYTVASGDGDDQNGVSVRANSLSLNGGTITDALGIPLELNHNALPDMGTGHQVDTTPPQVSTITFTSAGPYGIGSDIAVTVTTNEPVNAAGGATLTIIIGSTERIAISSGGTSTTTLVFRYRVLTSDKDDTNGIAVKANSLRSNGGIITDTAGNALDLNHSGVANAGDSQAVGTTVATVRSVTFTSTGPYKVNDIIKATVVTSETVTVTGTPRLIMVIGTGAKYANYVSGSGSTSLVFEYTVVAGDEDTDGVEIPQNALEHYNGSTIKSSNQTDLNLSHAGVAADPKHTVDTLEPEITNVGFSPDTPAVYATGDTIEVVVTLEESGVQVKPSANGDLPSVTLLFGSNTGPDSRKTQVTANYKESREGSTKLIFTYPVTADTPIDADGVQIKPNSLRIPPGGSIHDINGNLIQGGQTQDGGSLIAITPSDRLSSPPIFPVVSSNEVIFNEFLNASNDKHDWVEIRNTTTNGISLGGWKLDLSINQSTQVHTYEFPEIILPPGAVMLLMNARHKETRLELSYAYSYRYLIIPKMRLPKTDFALMLRDDAEGVVDVVGDHFSNAETAHATALFEENQAYSRSQPDKPGYEATAWQRSGYQAGLGYNRNASQNLSLGTPGYPKSALTGQHGAETIPVSISEIMYATGKPRRLPQWIELYNASKTDVISLQGWRLQFEGYDPTNAPTHSFLTFNIQTNLQILPNQTVLIVTKNGRNSRHFPEPRVYNLTEQNPDKLEKAGADAQLIKEVGFAIVLRDDTGKQVDVIGNLDGENGTRDEPKWKLFNCVTNGGNRLSIIRQFEEGKPLGGTQRSSWFRATDIRQKIPTYYGHPNDVGNPGYKKGGPLPVQLSSFKAERTEAGCVITWQTESELENAGFNVFRSETKNGTFTKVNPRMIPGAGTTSERNTYQYIDKGTKPRNHYYYRLEEVSFGGVHQTLTTQRLRRNISPIGQQLTTLGALKKQDL